jgi:hypothetical protein
MATFRAGNFEIDFGLPNYFRAGTELRADTEVLPLQLLIKFRTLPELRSQNMARRLRHHPCS